MLVALLPFLRQKGSKGTSKTLLMVSPIVECIIGSSVCWLPHFSLLTIDG